jgi:hypothetical protein
MGWLKVETAIDSHQQMFLYLLFLLSKISNFQTEEPKVGKTNHVLYKTLIIEREVFSNLLANNYIMSTVYCQRSAKRTGNR